VRPAGMPGEQKLTLNPELMRVLTSYNGTESTAFQSLPALKRDMASLPKLLLIRLNWIGLF
jgi:hypothetical protein